MTHKPGHQPGQVQCPRKPTCGAQGSSSQPSVSGIFGDIITAFGIIGGISTLIGVFEKTAVFALWGLSAPVAVWLGAIAGALITTFIVIDFYVRRCHSGGRPLQACSAGVIQTIVPSFNSATDEIFPFTAMHDRVDVVVKCVYWFLVENAAAFVHCNTDPDSSPMLRGYYKSDKVCGAGLGSLIGALVGAAVGIFLGVLAGGAIASLACGPFAWLCLILAVLVALIVAAVCVLIGAFAGGQIGKAAAGEDPPTADDGSTLSQSDYVTTEGGLIASGDDEGARVYWFVDKTTLHGRSSSSSPFSHTDPDAELVPDACPVVIE